MSTRNEGLEPGSASSSTSICFNGIASLELELTVLQHIASEVRSYASIRELMQLVR
jgi:hypothetical protein